VYELEGDTLTIWGGEKGSPAYYQGRFSQDGNTISGAWMYPGGGGCGGGLHTGSDQQRKCWPPSHS
jgi:hypothetical protein